MKIKWWIAGLLVCLALASLAPLASPAPDGLERVAEDNGFIDLAQEAPFKIISGYVFPGVHDGTLATILAGLTGTLLLFTLVYILGWWLAGRKKTGGKHGEA